MNELVASKEYDRLLGIFDKEEYLLKEAELEKEYMYCIQKLDKDVVVTDIGKKESRSIGIQINNWIKTLDDNEKDAVLTLQGSSNAYSEFRKYILGKYSGKKAKEWEEKLSNPDFEKDTIRLMRSRIYEHKAQRTREGVQMFVNADAHFLYQHVELNREMNRSQHESLNRVLKVLAENEDVRYEYLAENKDLIVESMKEAYEHVVGELIPKLIPNRENKIDTYLEEVKSKSLEKV